MPCMGGTCDKEFINKITEDFLNGMYRECAEDPPRPEYYAGDMWYRGWYALKEYRPKKNPRVLSACWIDCNHQVNGHRLGDLHALLVGILIGAGFPDHNDDEWILGMMRDCLESIEYSWF